MAITDESAAKTHFSTAAGRSRIWRVDEPQRLEDFLRGKLPGSSRESVRRALAAGMCQVDGRVRHKGFRLAGGEMVALDESARITEIWPEKIALEILYEDAELLAVNKPSGMLVHPTSRERTGTVGNALLGMGHADARFLHRLDRGTSGVLLAAKTLARRSPLAKLFEARVVEKRYVAVLTGKVDWDERVVTLPIGRVAGQRPPWNVLEEGAGAETRLRVLARAADGVVVDAVPITGRTNQIRIHCSAIGNPIVGDTAYGGAEGPRLLLHAWKLAFPGLDGEMRRITAPVPAGFPPFTEAG